MDGGPPNGAAGVGATAVALGTAAVGKAAVVPSSRMARRPRDDPFRAWLERRRQADVAVVYLILVTVVALVGFTLVATVLAALCAVPFPGAAEDAMALEDAQQEGAIGARAVLWPMNYSSIPMNRPEADLLASYLNPEHIMLEWGEGGISRALQGRVHQAHLISSSIATCNELAHDDKIETRCVAIRGITDDDDSADRRASPPVKHATYEQARVYVNVVEQLGVEKFDIVVIDGRARAACALRVLPFLKPSSRVIMHDFFGRLDLYGGVMQYYDEVARVIAYEHKAGADKPKGMIVLKRKDIVTDDLVPLPEGELHEMYIHANIDKELYASRVGAFNIVGRTADNGFHLKEWKDEKKLNMSLYRLLCDALVLMAVLGSLRSLRIIYEGYFDPIFQQANRSWPAGRTPLMSA